MEMEKSSKFLGILVRTVHLTDQKWISKTVHCTVNHIWCWNKDLLMKSWTYNWGGLTTLLSMCLSLRYLFIHPNVWIYILMNQKWSKIRARFAFWLNVIEIQLPKYIRKDRDPDCLDSSFISRVSFTSFCMR